MAARQQTLAAINLDMAGLIVTMCLYWLSCRLCCDKGHFGGQSDIFKRAPTNTSLNSSFSSFYSVIQDKLLTLSEPQLSYLLDVHISYPYGFVVML